MGERAVCDDDVVLLPTARPSQRGKSFLPWMCSLTLVAVGFGGRAVWTRKEGGVWSHDVIAREENFCTRNGDDCRHSKCCAEPNSRCYRKNEHWASCNETCS